MLDALVTRYHLLPSEILARSDTLDVLVMDTAMAWEKYQEERHRAKREGRAAPAPKMDVNTMQSMLTAVRKQ